MMDIDAAGEEIAAAGATVAEDVIGYGFAPDNPVAPAFFPESWEVDFTDERLTMLGDGALYSITFVLLVSRSDDKSGQARRNTLVRAIDTAIRTASYDAFSDLAVNRIRAPGDFREYGTTSYLVAEIDVEVFG